MAKLLSKLTQLYHLQAKCGKQPGTLEMLEEIVIDNELEEDKMVPECLIKWIDDIIDQKENLKQPFVFDKTLHGDVINFLAELEDVMSIEYEDFGEGMNFTFNCLGMSSLINREGKSYYSTQLLDKNEKTAHDTEIKQSSSNAKLNLIWIKNYKTKTSRVIFDGKDDALIQKPIEISIGKSQNFQLDYHEFIQNKLGKLKNRLSEKDLQKINKFCKIKKINFDGNYFYKSRDNQSLYYTLFNMNNENSFLLVLLAYGEIQPMRYQLSIQAICKLMIDES